MSNNPNPGLPVGVMGTRPGPRAELKPATGVGDVPANLPATGEELSRTLALAGEEVSYEGELIFKDYPPQKYHMRFWAR